MKCGNVFAFGDGVSRRCILERMPAENKIKIYCNKYKTVGQVRPANMPFLDIICPSCKKPLWEHCGEGWHKEE